MALSASSLVSACFILFAETGMWRGRRVRPVACAKWTRGVTCSVATRQARFYIGSLRPPYALGEWRPATG